MYPEFSKHFKLKSHMKIVWAFWFLFYSFSHYEKSTYPHLWKRSRTWRSRLSQPVNINPLTQRVSRAINHSFPLCDPFQILLMLGNACGLVQREVKSVKDWEEMSTLSTSVILLNEAVTEYKKKEEREADSTGFSAVWISRGAVSAFWTGCVP